MPYRAPSSSCPLDAGGEVSRPDRFYHLTVAALLLVERKLLALAPAATALPPVRRGRRRGASQHDRPPPGRQRLPLRLPHRPHRRALLLRRRRPVAGGHDEVAGERRDVGCEKAEELGRSTTENVVREEAVYPVRMGQTASSTCKSQVIPAAPSVSRISCYGHTPHSVFSRTWDGVYRKSRVCQLPATWPFADRAGRLGRAIR